MKIQLTTLCLALGFCAFAQTPPLGSPPPNNTNAQAGAAWYRGGNFPVGSTPPGANIFGTQFNSPIYTITNGLNRMKLNGSFNYPLNGGPNLPRDGFLLLGGNNNNLSNNTTLYSGNLGAYSLLHLNGINPNGFAQESGYRDWMRYGIVTTHNQDMMFIGQRATAGADVTDAMLAWADNGGGTNGPDNMVFSFLGGGQGGGSDLIGTANFGREIMRMTAIGNVGIGPRFNNTWQPQSTLHQHQENSQPSWMQISNQLSGGVANANAPTNIQATDGLRWGINGANTAFIYNQENNHLLFSTNNTAGGNFAGTLERMRISHIGAPGIVNPGGIAANITRVSISHNPNAPVTRPLSLLHLGYNTGGVSTNPNATDGWRPWMDIGMFVTNNTDNVYIGLKNENGPLGDRQDAVLSWGDNQVSGFPPGNGPDNFRFIFTSTTAGTGGGTPPATGANGLEGLRMTPTANTGVFTGIGGDPSANLYSGGTQNANNSLEVNSWGNVTTQGGSSGLRFTDLNTTSPTLPNPGTGVLSVNAQGDVIYVPASAGSAFGNACGATQNPLTSDYEIPLNGFNYVFSDPPTLLHGVNNVRVGAACTAPAFNAKFEVWRNPGTVPSGVNSIAGVLGVNSDRFPSLVVGQRSYGGFFLANGGTASAPVNYEVYGVSGIARNGRINYGGYFEAAQNNLLGYGIYARAISNGSGTGSLAGYFDGDVFINGVGNGSSGIFYTSDSRLKTGIDTITDAISIIKQLQPKTFYYDTTNSYNLRLSNKKQYGFIAQDVEAFLPELIGSAKKQQEVDSLGNVTGDSITYKTVNYNALIGLLTRAVQQQQHKIDSLVTKTSKQDSINNAVQQQIAALASQINGCCSNGNARTSNPNQTGSNQLDVELSDKDAIVLNQNVPNPFAEQTTITYNVPESVGKAQLIFYNSAGQIIQTVDIKTRGKGKVNVFASDLSSGLYHYTLVADGKVVDSKKMVRE